MGWFSDEIMFYGGIAVTIGALLAGILLFFLSKINAMRLQGQLDQEYGKEEGRNKKNGQAAFHEQDGER